MISYMTLKKLLDDPRVYLKRSFLNMIEGYDIPIDSFEVSSIRVHCRRLVLDLDYSEYKKDILTLEDLGVMPDSHYNCMSKVTRIRNSFDDIKREMMDARQPWYVLVDTETYQFMRILEIFHGDISQYTLTT